MEIRSSSRLKWEWENSIPVSIGSIGGGLESGGERGRGREREKDGRWSRERRRKRTKRREKGRGTGGESNQQKVHSAPLPMQS